MSLYVYFHLYLSDHYLNIRVWMFVDVVVAGMWAQDKTLSGCTGQLDTQTTNMTHAVFFFESFTYQAGSSKEYQPILSSLTHNLKDNTCTDQWHDNGYLFIFIIFIYILGTFEDKNKP